MSGLLVSTRVIADRSCISNLRALGMRGGKPPRPGPPATDGYYGVLFAAHQIATIGLTSKQGVGHGSERVSVMSPGSYQARPKCGEIGGHRDGTLCAGL